MKQQNDQRIQLWVDNAPSHIFDQSIITNIDVEFLELNLTSRIQYSTT